MKKPVSEIIFEAERKAIESEARYEASKAKYELVSKMLNTVMLLETSRIYAIIMAGFFAKK